MLLTAELKTKLLTCIREEFGDDPTMADDIARLEEVSVGYNLDQVDLDPNWDALVEDTNWVDAWLRYYRIIQF